MKTERIKCLVDEEQAHELMGRAREILRAAEQSGDETLRFSLSGYRMAERLREMAVARRKDLTVRCMDETPDGEQARADVWHAEQLMAYFVDLAQLCLDWETHKAVSALSVTRDDDEK